MVTILVKLIKSCQTVDDEEVVCLVSMCLCSHMFQCTCLRLSEPGAQGPAGHVEVCHSGGESVSFLVNT